MLHGEFEFGGKVEVEHATAQPVLCLDPALSIPKLLAGALEEESDKKLCDDIIMQWLEHAIAEMKADERWSIESRTAGQGFSWKVPNGSNPTTIKGTKI